MQKVFITTLCSIKASVGLFHHLSQAAHTNVWRQKAVELVHQLRPTQLSSPVEMDDLLAGMHPGISAAAAHNGYWLPQDGTQAGFQLLLHGMRIVLDLPAMIGSAVVGDIEEVAKQA